MDRCYVLLHDHRRHDVPSYCMRPTPPLCKLLRPCQPSPNKRVLSATDSSSQAPGEIAQVVVSGSRVITTATSAQRR